MLDFFRLAIPVIPTHVRGVGNHWYFDGDIRHYGLPAATRHVGLADDGTTTMGDLYHPYESLPSDFTDMAVKFYTNTMNAQPYLEIKGSPLKLTQGHNVYGFECMHFAAMHMLGMLCDALPKLMPILDFDNIEVLCLDTTYFIKLPHQNMVQPLLDYMANIAVGHRKAKKVKYDNYITWGNDEGRYIRPKAYGKYKEVLAQLNTVQKQADKGCPRSKALVCVMHDVLPFANATARFEARICKTYLSKNCYPTNLWKLIERQRSEPDLLFKLWGAAFNPIFNALGDKNMNFSDDGQVLDLLRSKLFTITKSGKTSYTKANNAFKFYCLIRQSGWEAVKAIYAESTFYDNVKALQDADIDRAHLQNLHKNPNGTVIPFVRLLELKLDQQLPDGYQLPVSKYADFFRLSA